MPRATLAAIVFALGLPALAAPEVYTLDPSHTYPYFAINHLGYSTLYGHFNKTSGRITMDREAKTGSIEIVIDATSVDTGHTKRDEHLRSADFFNVQEFPFITFKTSAVTFDAEANVTGVEGELTLHGVTKTVPVQVEFMRCADHPMDKSKYVCGFGASAQINRSDFNMKYGLPAIGEEVRLIFEVEAQRNDK